MIPLCQSLIHLYKTVYKSRVLDVLSKKHEQIDRKYIARIYSFAKGSMVILMAFAQDVNWKKAATLTSR